MILNQNYDWSWLEDDLLLAVLESLEGLDLETEVDAVQNVEEVKIEKNLVEDDLNVLDNAAKEKPEPEAEQ